MSDFVVVNDRIETAGVITFWRMAGDCPFATLEKAWSDAGFSSDDLPPLPSASAACRRAVHENCDRATFARRLPSGGLAIVREDTNGHTLRHEPILHVGATSLGRLAFYDPRTMATVAAPVAVSGDVHDLAAAIAASYTRHITTVTAADASAWLVRRVGTYGAIPLRDTGGFYFIPHPASERWASEARVIRDATPHDIGLISAMRTEEAVRTILASLEEEANAEAAKMFEDITSGSLGERALHTRGDRCDALIRKVSDYERLLGVSADALRERLDDLKTSLAAATLVATSDAKATGILAL